MASSIMKLNSRRISLEGRGSRMVLFLLRIVKDAFRKKLMDCHIEEVLLLFSVVSIVRQTRLGQSASQS